MSDNIQFFTNPMSRGRIVRWMLEEVGQPYETHVLDYGTTMKAPEYLALNPMGKVPTIIDRGVVVTEAAAICTYLADAYPAAGLAPALHDPMRGIYQRWLFFAAGPFEAATTAKSLGLLAPVEKAGMVGYGTYDDTLDALEAAVSGPGAYLLGDQFTAADIYVGSQIGFGLMFKSLPDRDAFKAYWGRISDRPAAVRARGLDDALMPTQN